MVVARSGRGRASRCGVVVPDASSREPEDRRADRLLHGEGRRLRRRRPSAVAPTGSAPGGRTAHDPDRRLTPCPGSRPHERCGLRDRPGRGPVPRGQRSRVRHARVLARGAARDAGLADPRR